MKIISPITQSENVEVCEQLSTQSIVKSYLDYLNIDVQRYMPNDSSVQVCRCKDTGLRFFWPPTMCGDESFYQDLTKAFPYSVSFRWEHKKAIQFIKPRMKVLEVGCGPGIFLDKVRSLGASCVGLELNSDIAKIAQSKNLDVESQLIEEHIKDNALHYDVVCFFQVLEHVTNVSDFIKCSLQALKSGGLLIVGVPNNNPWLFKYDRMNTLNLPPHHMGLWDQNSLTSLASYFSMDLIDIAVEPMLFARQQLKAILLNNNMPVLAKIAARMPALVDRIAGRLIGRCYPGRNLVAVYRKR